MFPRVLEFLIFKIFFPSAPIKVALGVTLENRKWGFWHTPGRSRARPEEYRLCICRSDYFNDLNTDFCLFLRLFERNWAYLHNCAGPRRPGVCQNPHFLFSLLSVYWLLRRVYRRILMVICDFHGKFCSNYPRAWKLFLLKIDFLFHTWDLFY